VVDPDEQVTVSNAAQGNYASGGVQDASVWVQSSQTMDGSAEADTRLTLEGDTNGVVNATTQARGNYLAVSAYNGDLRTDATQLNNGANVRSTTVIDGTAPRLLGGGYVSSVAVSNAIAMGGEGSTVSGSLSQGSFATVQAETFAATQYVPAEARFSSQAVANAVDVNSDLASNQSLYVRQRSQGALVDANTSANAGNAWDMSSRANAAGNQGVFVNQGGALIVETDQSNQAQIRSNAINTAYDYGAIEAYAQAAGNQLHIGNNDVYVQIDNTQFNDGGVQSTASFAGHNGYDVYVGADAVGNGITGYGCAACQGTMDTTNNQVNNGAVSATANTSITGSARAVITGTNATGNAATFYVSRPGN
jgi:hypothetical protein